MTHHEFLHFERLRAPGSEARGSQGEIEVDHQNRRRLQTEAFITDLEVLADNLEREISREQDRVGIKDPAHFAYPIYAKAARTRRDNLRKTAEALKQELAKLG